MSARAGQHHGSTAPGTDEISATLEVVEYLVSAGYFEIGNLSDRPDVGFEPWLLRKADALSKMRTDWEALSEPINLNDVCWLRSTAEGDRIGELIIDTWTRSGNDDPVDIELWIARDRYGLSDGRIP